jgi:hypothetical protein
MNSIRRRRSLCIGIEDGIVRASFLVVLLLLSAGCDRQSAPTSAVGFVAAPAPRLDSRFRDKALDFLAAAKNAKGPLSSDVQLAALQPDMALESPKTRGLVEEVRRAYNAIPPARSDAEYAVQHQCLDIRGKLSELGYAIAKARWDDHEGKQAREDLAKGADGKQLDKLVQALEKALAGSD